MCAFRWRACVAEHVFTTASTLPDPKAMNATPQIRAVLNLIRTAALVLACASTSHAQVAGSFDTTFGATNGYVPALVISTNNDDRAHAMALQSDGKIVLAGKCAGALGTYFCMARLNADGSIDTSFDGPGTPGNGKFLMSVAGSLSAGAYAVAVQPDGKIVVSGTCSGKFCIARLNENGSFDTTFTGIGGTSAGHFALTIGTSTDTLTGMALQPDGMMVLTGNCADPTGSAPTLFCVARLTANGDFDGGFDGPPPVSPANGRFLVPHIGSNATYPEGAQAVLINSTGKILLAGSCRDVEITACLVKLNANGSFDSTFDGASGAGNGKVALDLGRSINIDFTKIVLQADDYVLVPGHCSDALSGACVVRVKPDGVIDTSFGGNLSSASYPLGVAHAGNGVFVPIAAAVHFDGRIVLAGPNFQVTRLSGDGFPDNTFDGPPPSNADGFVQVSLGTFSQVSRAMQLQPDGKILLAGYCQSSFSAPTTFCIARLNPGSSGARNCTPDIDGDGRTTATVDGLIMMRVMLGLTGTAVTGGITFPTTAPRKTWSAIRSYLVTHCAMTLGP